MISCSILFRQPSDRAPRQQPVPKRLFQSATPDKAQMLSELKIQTVMRSSSNPAIALPSGSRRQSIERVTSPLIKVVGLGADTSIDTDVQFPRQRSDEAKILSSATLERSAVSPPPGNQHTPKSPSPRTSLVEAMKVSPRGSQFEMPASISPSSRRVSQSPSLKMDALIEVPSSELEPEDLTFASPVQFHRVPSISITSPDQKTRVSSARTASPVRISSPLSSSSGVRIPIQSSVPELIATNNRTRSNSGAVVPTLPTIPDVTPPTTPRTIVDTTDADPLQPFHLQPTPAGRTRAFSSTSSVPLSPTTATPKPVQRTRSTFISDV